MGANRSALGLVGALAVAAALLSAGAGRAAATTCGALNRQNGALASSDELSDATFVSAAESWAVGDVGIQNAPDYLHPQPSLSGQPAREIAVRRALAGIFAS